MGENFHGCSLTRKMFNLENFRLYGTSPRKHTQKRKFPEGNTACKEYITYSTMVRCGCVRVHTFFASMCGDKAIDSLYHCPLLYEGHVLVNSLEAI